jgi:CDP-glucose 4,6-dehydratase
LVTGGSGLLGSWLVRALVQNGARVVTVTRTQTTDGIEEGSSDSLKRISGSVTDGEMLRDTVSTYSVDTIFHLAAQSLVGSAKDDPANTLDVNIRGTWNVLEASRATGKCQVLVASSAKIYSDDSDVSGPDNLGRYQEDDSRGRHPYEVSKSCADLITRMYGETYGLPVTSLRFVNIFGGGDLNFSRIIPGAIRAALSNENFVIRGRGSATHDYLYVEDAVRGCLLLAEKMAMDPHVCGQAFNFGLERRISVLELVDAISRITGRQDLKPVLPAVPSEGDRQIFVRTDKARRILHWSPKFGIEEGLRASIEWYSKYCNQERYFPVPS